MSVFKYGNNITVRDSSVVFTSQFGGTGSLSQYCKAYDGVSGATYVCFLFTVVSTSTTNFGIKVPISSSDGTFASILGNNYCSNEALFYSGAYGVGATPNPGFPSGGTYSIVYEPLNTNRQYWNISSDSNYIYFYTTNTSMMSLFTVGQSYWFCISQNQATSVNTGVDFYTPGIVTTQTLSNIQGFSGAYYYTGTVMDYNA